MGRRSSDYWESRGWVHYGPHRWERYREEMDMEEFNRQMAEAAAAQWKYPDEEDGTDAKG